MKKYEVMFIIEAALEDDKKESVVETVKEIITADGEVEKVDVWGNKKLAYPINKKFEGYYVVIEFSGNISLPKELDRRLKIMESVIRHMITSKE